MAGIDITQHATSEPVSLDMAKRQCQVNLDFPDDDEYLMSLVSSAREKAELHTARSYLTRGFREYFDGFPEDRLPIPYNVTYDIPTRHDLEPEEHRLFELGRSPLQFVSAVQYLDLDGNQQTLDPSLYRVARWKEPAHIRHAPRSCWPRPIEGVDSVWVDYVAGYGAPVILSIGEGSQVIDGASFAPQTVGQSIVIPGAGVAGVPLQTTILSVDDTGNAALANPVVAAVVNVSAWLGRPVAAIAIRAMLMLVTHWYENRLPVASASLKELPYAVKDLLDANRVYYQA